MRWSVFVSDLIFFFPAVFFFLSIIEKKIFPLSNLKKIKYSLVILLQPGLLLIDHCHFQYNCVSLGLSLYSIAFFLDDFDFLGCFFFVLALNYKQMSLYFAPTIFFYLLGKTFRREKNLFHFFKKIFMFAFFVLSAFFLIWSPWLLLSNHPLKSAFQIFHRVFPVSRGLFEDKVSNFWCFSNIFIKWKCLFSTSQLVFLSALFTFFSFLPATI
eukprot:Sdes_comp20583_c0_seq2m15536